MLIARIDITEDEDVPKGVRDYFHDWGRRCTVLGMSAIVVSQRLFFDADDQRTYFQKNKGVGPSHSVEQMRYLDDMPMEHASDRNEHVPRRMSVNAWVSRHIRQGGKKITELHEAGEKHVCDVACDD